MKLKNFHKMLVCCIERLEFGTDIEDDIDIDDVTDTIRSMYWNFQYRKIELTNKDK